MSLIKKIGTGIAAVGLAALLMGCRPNSEQDAIRQAYCPKQNGGTKETDERYIEQDKNFLAEFGEAETITTQITDIQDGFVKGDFRSLYPYKYVLVEGGDTEEMLLLYPRPLFFKKFRPAKITFRRIKNHGITAYEFIKLFYSANYGMDKACNFKIKVDGIIEPDGVEYIEGEK